MVSQTRCNNKDDFYLHESLFKTKGKNLTALSFFTFFKKKLPENNLNQLTKNPSSSSLEKIRTASFSRNLRSPSPSFFFYSLFSAITTVMKPRVLRPVKTFRLWSLNSVTMETRCRSWGVLGGSGGSFRASSGSGSVSAQ